VTTAFLHNGTASVERVLQKELRERAVQVEQVGDLGKREKRLKG